MARINWSRAQVANKETRTRLEPVYGPGQPLGALAVCWCGKPTNHDWDGKAEGAGHPKES